MKIQPKKGILVIKRHNKTALKVDIIDTGNEEDRRLITGEVVSNSEQYKKGSTVIFGKYALYLLTIQGEDFYLLDEEDVVGTCEYKE